VNVYAISKDWLPGAVNDPPQGCPGFGQLEVLGSNPGWVVPKYTNKDICVSPEAHTSQPSPPAHFWDLMKNPHSYPAIKDQTLWYDKNLFMGGLPAVTLDSDSNGATFGGFGHGFKGYIFEILMFEGVLNTTDKITLFNILKAKYNKGLG